MPVLSRRVLGITANWSKDDARVVDVKMLALSPEGERLELELTLSRDVANTLATAVGALLK